MSIKVLEFGPIPDLEDLDFQTLMNRLEKDLGAIKDAPDLESLLNILNPLLRDERYNKEEHLTIKRLRQRAYDRRRNPKFQMFESVDQAKPKHTIPNLDPNPPKTALLKEPKPTVEAKIELGAPMITAITEKALVPKPKNENFSQGALRAFASIDGEYVVRTAPKLLLWLVSSALVSYLLWQQSIDLYSSAGFKDSFWAATGGITMIIGFAAFYAVTRSKLALLLCCYVSSYEAYLMISGTITDEHQIQIQSVQTNPDLEILKEKASKSLVHYHELKARYDNPESKVFKNDWFLKTHLNPAWQESLADHDELMAKEAALGATVGTNHITWLKIFYRLGLVFLCMMLVHRFFAVWAENK